MGTRRLRIATGELTITAILDDSPVADALWAALPIQGRVQTWGDEIYFSIPIDAPPHPASARATVDLGAVGFWPPGNALCLFYGRTPMSRGDEIRPASPVNVLGRMEGDPTILRKAVDGRSIVIEAATLEGDLPDVPEAIT